MDERRKEVRMLCADMVEARWKEPSGRKRRVLALLEDISPSGACLQLESAVPIGASIQWESAKREFKGQVQYCVYREIGYFIGVVFDASCKWSKKMYEPRHLLDLRCLLENARK